ncbi:MAG: hypothetical protein KDK51_00850 [Deltaproteobacteria bacterium]|nr:hypothetical protein [Deltaproteobacteria bacterium]
MALTRFQNVDQIEKDVDQLVTDMERLRKDYEQYFLGLTRENPQRLREKVGNLVRKNHGTPIQNARLKFRYQQAISRFNTYCTYWDRILRKIEEGSYERDLFKANLHEKNRPAGVSNQTSESSDDMYKLYQTFQQAKDQLNQSLSNVSYKKFQQQLESKKALLQEKHKGHDITFKITSEDGKVKIKPVAKKKIST